MEEKVSVFKVHGPAVLVLVPLVVLMLLVPLVKTASGKEGLTCKPDQDQDLGDTEVVDCQLVCNKYPRAKCKLKCQLTKDDVFGIHCRLVQASFRLGQRVLTPDDCY